MTDTASQNSGSSAEDFLEKLKKALQTDGDFPASAKVVTELRKLTQNPKTTSNQIAEIILKEPSLGTRVLSLVNSSFYQRRKPIMTVSQAVVQIGMKPLSELCAGLILLQKFVPKARRGGAFANCLKKTVVTSLLASTINSQINDAKGAKTEETGYLTGSFYELGTLLLAYYFPQLYDTAVRRAETKNVELAQSIKQITGLSPVEISIEVIEALELPQFYRTVLTSSMNPPDDPGDSLRGSEEGKIAAMSRAVYAAKDISGAIVENRGKAGLDKALAKINRELGIDTSLLGDVVGTLPQLFSEHCASIEVDLPSLPDFVEAYSEDPTALSEIEEEMDEGSQFMDFVEEIRLAVENREPTASVITTVMETFAWGLGFDRVVLLLVDQHKKTLIGRMSLGVIENFVPGEFKRPLGRVSDIYAPDATAFKEARPVFTGDPVLKDGWPLAAIPVGFGIRAIGVIYADRSSDDDSELSSREQASIGVLAELLDKSISINS